MTNNSDKNKLYKMVQDYLKSCPVIIWGSGATIPFGMPSMDDLKKTLDIRTEGNLEEILSKINDNNKQKKYEEGIFKSINVKDMEFRTSFLKDPSRVVHVKDLIGHFYKSHPQRINIITTNYDCVLEYIFSHHDFPYSDGFSGREFSSFSESRFKSNKHINLYKVHGSLRWYKSKYSYYNSMMDGIFPSNQKYKEAYQEPFRTIISCADKAIHNAQCFLAVGFGFNDEHLTPKIDTAIQNNSKIVVIAKKATDSCREKLEKASNYILLEKGQEQDTTLFTCKENNQEKKSELQGNYWEIQKFNEIIRFNYE